MKLLTKVLEIELPNVDECTNNEVVDATSAREANVESAATDEEATGDGDDGIGKHCP